MVVTYIVILIACLIVSAFFSSSETALLRLRKHEIEGVDDIERGPAAAAIRSLLSSTSRLLVTILLGNNVVNILGASVAATLAIQFLGPEIGLLTSTLAMTVVVLVFCEVIPKAVAASHPEGVAHTVALPLYIFHQMLRPIHGLFDRVIEPLVRRITGGRNSEESLSSEEVLRLARAARNGDTEGRGNPLAIIGATSHAAEMKVDEIMVPRTEIVAFQQDTPPADLLKKVLEDRYTRVPIYEESIDDVSGTVHLKDLIKLVGSEGEDLLTILKPVLRVPERKPILRLLADMQRGFIHMAIVKDEFAVTLGLVTQEDILEEIVGEIRDEFDSEELLEIRSLADGTYEALARVSVLDFNRESGWEVPAERGDTLGGLMFNTLEHAPLRGELAEMAGYSLRCLDVSGTRITRVQVMSTLKAEGLEGDEAS